MEEHGKTLTEAREEIRKKLPEDFKPENMSIRDQNNCRLGGAAEDSGPDGTQGCF